ncbi:MAG: addiction module protein [Nitrospirota bacterium]
MDYVQSLWERIAASPQKVPVPDWHLRILQERLKTYKANPAPGQPWEDVRAEIERKLRDQSF